VLINTDERFAPEVAALVEAEQSAADAESIRTASETLQ